MGKSKTKTAQTKTEERLSRLKAKVDELERKIAKAKERNEIRNQIKSLKDKLNQLK